LEPELLGEVFIETPDEDAAELHFGSVGVTEVRSPAKAHLGADERGA